MSRHALGSQAASTLPSLPIAFWATLFACALATVLLWWFALGARRHARKLRLVERIAQIARNASNSSGASSASTSRDAAQDTGAATPLAEDLRRSMRPAVAMQRERAKQKARAKAHAMHDALYAVPWLLCITDAAAHAGQLFASQVAGSDADAEAGSRATNADPMAIAEDSHDTDEAFWRWWSLPELTVVAIRPSFIEDPSTPRAEQRWFQALLTLAETRFRLPLNGIVVCVAASSLLGDPAAMELRAMRIVRRLEQAADALRLHLPVYLLVSGLEDLPGCEIARAALPEALRRQAVGHRFTIEADSDGASIDEVLAPIDARLHMLRMSLLHDAHDAEQRRAIYVFIESLHALQPALKLLAQRLFDRPDRHRLLHWRGLYLMAAPASASSSSISTEASSLFAADVFERFLPRDQPLARHGTP